jgi:hypothetical protein
MLGAGGVAVIDNVLHRICAVLRSPPCLVCGAVGLAGAAMDLDHLLPGLSRQTHLLVAVAAWAGLGLYVSLSSRRVAARVLGVRA